MRRDFLSLLLFPIFLAGLGLLFLSLKTVASSAVEQQAGADGSVIYQSTYFSSRTDAGNHQVQWIGDLQAISVDNLGNQHSLWSASQQLSSLADVVTQRPYQSRADSGRYLFTYLDTNGDGAVEDTEIRDFIPSTFSSGVYGILDVPDESSAEVLVNYIRGDESQNASQHLRDRTLDLDNDGDREVMRLGDIVHSSALEVGAPSEAYDLLYGDSSYGRFRSQYAHRRRVVYVGANDGMIHAFNAGFYDNASHFYKVQSGPSDIQHPLGSELWAYIPYNLLPQLKHLQAPDDDHVWYIDGRPRVFDARIFAEDPTHPGGWGTVLVMGMRFGGSPTVLNPKDNSRAFSAWTPNGAAVSTIRCQSAYVLIDITDPETTPTLLAEITDPSGSMGYTSSQPTVVTFNTADNKSSSSDSRWYLVFGSGPALTQADQSFSATTGSSAKLYVYDLVKRQLIGNGDKLYRYDLGNDPRTGAPASFVGDPVAVDWDMDDQADALYFGTIGGNESSPNGKLFKLDFRTPSEKSAGGDWPTPAVLINVDNPVVSAPALTRDEHNNHWVIAGTGRLYTDGDTQSTQTQSLFAVIDTLPKQNPEYGNLVETSNAIDDGTRILKGVPGATTPEALARLIREHKGWKRTLKQGTGAAAERSVGRISLIGDTLFATTFTPGNTPSVDEGHSRLYCLDYKTGMPTTGTASCIRSSASTYANNVTKDAVDLGPGLTTSPVLQFGSTTDSGLFVFTSTSNGIVNRSSAGVVPSARSGEIDWREIQR